MPSHTEGGTMRMLPIKPPEFLIKMLEVRNYTEEVASIKAVDFPAVGGEMPKIRRTRKGHALIEFGNKPGSQAAVSRLDEAIKSKSELRMVE